MNKPHILIACPETTADHTQGKFLFLAPHLKDRGYEPLVIVWGDIGERMAKAKALPYIRLQILQREFNKVEEAQKFRALLERPLVEAVHAPTWGDLLAFDDFIGASQHFTVEGLGMVRPACIVAPLPGSEASTAEDEQLYLALWRFSRMNRIPFCGVEVQRLDGPLLMGRRPVDAIVTQHLYAKEVLQEWSSQAFLLAPAHRYYVRGDMDPMIEQFLEQEKTQRTQLGWKPGVRYVLVPFHLYYAEECFRALQELGQIKQQRGFPHEVLVTCGLAHRRDLKEKDMIMEGGKRWWRDLGTINVLEGGMTAYWMLLSEAIIVPYASASLEHLIWKWDLRQIRPHEVPALEPYVVPGEVIDFLVNEEEQQ